MNDDTWAEEYSALPPSTLRSFRDSWDQDDDGITDPMDRFQDPDNGRAYRITIDFDIPTLLEARMLADIVRASVRKHVDGEAEVTFEAHREVGSEALVPRFTHPSHAGRIVTP